MWSIQAENTENGEAPARATGKSRKAFLREGFHGSWDWRIDRNMPGKGGKGRGQKRGGWNENSPLGASMKAGPISILEPLSLPGLSWPPWSSSKPMQPIWEHHVPLSHTPLCKGSIHIGPCKQNPMILLIKAAASFTSPSNPPHMWTAFVVSWKRPFATTASSQLVIRGWSKDFRGSWWPLQWTGCAGKSWEEMLNDS